MESLDLASSDQPALGACLNEANTPLEEGVPVVSPPNVEEVRMGAPSGVVTAPTPPPKSIGAEPSKKRLLDRVLVSMYVSPLEMVHPSTNMVVPDLEDVLKLVHHWNPLNHEEFWLRTYATFIRITSRYPWRPAQSSILFLFLFIWIRRHSSLWPMMGCSSATITSTDQLNW